MPIDTERRLTESQIRTWVANWTPSKLRTLEYEARAGILSRVADLCDILVTDDRIKAVLDVRVNGLLGLDVMFYSEDDVEDEESPIVQALNEDFWAMYPESALGELYRWALLVGVGVAQHIWVRNDKTGRLEPHLDVWHPSNVGYDPYKETWYVETAAGRESIVAGEGNWIIFTPFGDKRPWTWGLWRLLGRWWLLKLYAVTDWARHSEAHGKPAYVVEVTDPQFGGSLEDRRNIIADLQQIGDLEAIAPPYGQKVHLLEAATTAHEVFVKQIENANDGIAIAILGQNLTTSVDSGSLAAAQVHERVRADIKEYDEQVLSTALRTQSIRWWTELNFGAQEFVPWARWNVTPPEDEQAKAETQKVSAEALRTFAEFVQGARASGIPIDLAMMAERFDIPLAAAQQFAQVEEARRTVTLASGVDAANVRGFVNGQGYVDSLVNRAAGFGSYQKSLDAALRAVRDADGYEDLRNRLVPLFESMEPDEADELARSLRLADMAGRKGVIDDL